MSSAEFNHHLSNTPEKLSTLGTQLAEELLILEEDENLNLKLMTKRKEELRKLIDELKNGVLPEEDAEGIRCKNLLSTYLQGNIKLTKNFLREEFTSGKKLGKAHRHCIEKMPAVLGETLRKLFVEGNAIIGHEEQSYLQPEQLLSDIDKTIKQQAANDIVFKVFNQNPQQLLREMSSLTEQMIEQDATHYEKCLLAEILMRMAVSRLLKWDPEIIAKLASFDHYLTTLSTGMFNDHQQEVLHKVNHYLHALREKNAA